ncbi:hypothetical protein [Furfurilactobacillus siliginis]|nr:hypothetical protein [Furfurilactobacillus siliginis]
MYPGDYFIVSGEHHVDYTDIASNGFRADFGSYGTWLSCVPATANQN